MSLYRSCFIQLRWSLFAACCCGFQWINVHKPFYHHFKDHYVFGCFLNTCLNVFAPCHVHVHLAYIYMYIHMPWTQLTSIFEEQPSKAKQPNFNQNKGPHLGFMGTFSCKKSTRRWPSHGSWGWNVQSFLPRFPPEPKARGPDIPMSCFFVKGLIKGLLTNMIP